MKNINQTKHHIWDTLRRYPVFTIGFFIVLTLQISGALLIEDFQYIDSFNKPIHFFMQLFGSPLLYLLIASPKARQITRSVGGVIFAVFLYGATAAVLWEIFEFIIEPITSDVWQISNTDTMLDLIAGICGSLVGGAILSLKLRRKLKK